MVDSAETMVPLPVHLTQKVKSRIKFLILISFRFAIISLEVFRAKDWNQSKIYPSIFSADLHVGCKIVFKKYT